MKKTFSGKPRLQNKPTQSPQETPVVANREDEIAQSDRRRRAMLLARIYESILSWDEEADATKKPNKEEDPMQSGSDNEP